MLTWIELLTFYVANVVVWLGIALLYVQYSYKSDDAILGSSQSESSSERGVDNG